MFKTFPLSQGCEDTKYRGAGHAVVIVKDGVVVDILYIDLYTSKDDPDSGLSMVETLRRFDIDMNGQKAAALAFKEQAEGGDAFLGMLSCHEFTVFVKV